MVSQSFRNPPRNEYSFLLAATFWIPYGHFDTINVIWCQFEYLAYPHPCSSLQLHNESVSCLHTGIDDFIYGLSVDNGPDTHSGWSKDPFDDETVASIAIQYVVEESSKVSAPAVPGALFLGTGQEGKKGEGFF
jgi:hypothetical protein